MEINQKFSISKCADYINSIEDFEIEFERKPSLDYNGAVPMYQAQRERVRNFLRIFLLECLQESAREEYDFLRWLDERKQFWKNQQYRIIGCLDDRSEQASGTEKIVIEQKKLRYSNFFKHHYKVIEIIETDILSTLDLPHFYLPPADSQHDVQPGTTGGFDALFKKGISSEPYYQLLRDHEYPLMGNEFNYVSKALKGGFCVWIYELQRQDIIMHQPDKVYAQLLLKKITGLKSFDHSLFRKTNNRSERIYREWFRKRIEIIKNIKQHD